MVGSFLVCTDDSTTTAAVYRIIAVPSSSSVTLDRVYNGSAAGAAKNITIKCAARYRSTSGVITDSTSLSDMRATAYAWGRLVVSENRNKRRLRWSGLVDAGDEGTSPFTGIYGFHDDGYLDMPESGGHIQRIIPFGDSVLVIQSRLITVLHGAPTFDGVGTLDASTSYSSRYLRSEAYVVTPYGLFFVSEEGLMLFTGSGRPTPQSTGLTTNAILVNSATRLGFFGGYLLLMTGTNDSLIYHVPTQMFTVMKNAESIQHPYNIQAGRGAYAGVPQDRTVGFNGKYTVDVSAGLDRLLGTYTDLGLDLDSGTMPLAVATPFVGPPHIRLCPEQMFTTYALDGTSTTLAVTVSTGLPLSTIDSTRTQTVTLTESEATAGGYETVCSQLNLAGDTMMKVSFTTAGTATRAEVMQIVVEGTVEGEWSSA